MGPLSVTTVGVEIAATTTSASVALPVVSGSVPKACRVAATAPVRVELGTSAGVTAGSGDLLVQPGDAVVLRTHRLTHLAAVALTGTAVVQISPIDV